MTTKPVLRPLILSGMLLCILVFSALLRPAIATTGSNSLACDPPKSAMTPGSALRTVTSDGWERQYLLHIPPGYDPARRTPVVMSLHGFTSNARAQVRMTDWTTLADAESFIAVFPQGLALFPFPARWAAGVSPFIANDPVDDVQFFRDLIAELSTLLCIDPARIYVNGLSNGAGMSHRLGCELADSITAIGGVAGAYQRIPGGCHPSRPVPVIGFHGRADPIAVYEGLPSQGIAGVEAWAAGWAARDGCNAVPERFTVRSDVSGIRYTGCQDDVEVVLYTIESGGHTWPGGPDLPIGGKTSRDIDASRVMWEFFERFAIRAH